MAKKQTSRVPKERGVRTDAIPIVLVTAPDGRRSLGWRRLRATMPSPPLQK